MRKIFIFTLLFFHTALYAFQKKECSGRITDTDKVPIQNATVKTKHSGLYTVTDANGTFKIQINDYDTLLVSYSGYISVSIAVTPGHTPDIAISRRAVVMEEVEVSTGYQNLVKERATGSFVQINNELLNRSVASNIIDRLEGNANGLAFHADAYGRKTLLVRGLSTLYSDASPLIVVDDFPYEGDIANLNPNDVASVTLLRDAAAASIWGARAGNGVIVIKTKNGKNNNTAQVNFVANTSVSHPANPFYLPVVLTPDLISIETMLFNNGYYNAAINNTTTFPILSPVVEILLAKRTGIITDATAQKQLDSLSIIDNRNDLNRILKAAVTQRYAINITGGSNRHNYYFSAGYDDNKGSNKSRVQRIAINYKQTLELNKKLSFNSNIYYSLNRQTAGTLAGVTPKYLYQRLIDEQGNGVVNTTGGAYRQSFIQQAMDKGFLNWSFNPVQEASLTNNVTVVHETRLQTGIKYKLPAGLDATINYQFQLQQTNNKDLHDANSYYVRNLVNSFTQVNTATGKVSARPIPSGAILDRSMAKTEAHNLRAQLNYAYTRSQHWITAIAGIEARQVHNANSSYRLYGYNDYLLLSNTGLDFVTNFQKYPTGSGRIDPGNSTGTEEMDRFKSVYLNAAYALKNRYTLSGSARKDASNLFGVKTNQRAVPLWSTGLKWDIHNENFFRTNIINQLSLRVSYGYNGNINKSVTAFTTIEYLNTPNAFNEPFAFIINPPNPNLRWEKNGILNFAINFELFNNSLSGSVEYFSKVGKDIFGRAPLDGTTGVGVRTSLTAGYMGNVASMRGSGVDVQINMVKKRGDFTWMPVWMFSLATDRLTDYYFLPNYQSLVIDGSLQPVNGRPVYGVYSFAWAGLDPATGDPVGWLNNEKSKNYTRLATPQNIAELVYHGNARAKITGAWRNTFIYKNFSLSMNISYKLQYYIRRPSINYNQLYLNMNSHTDYYKRWVKPGDELITNVPSMIYPNPSSARDVFYNYSEATVDKGDHIRLRETQLSYTLKKGSRIKIPFQQMQLHLLYNGGYIIWKAGKNLQDPDYILLAPPSPRNFSVGMNISF